MSTVHEYVCQKEQLAAVEMGHGCPPHLNINGTEKVNCKPNRGGSCAERAGEKKKWVGVMGINMNALE